MSVWQVIILGLVQGLTEFLPVSSSGHLVVARMLLRIPDVSGTTFDAFLHLGTFFAVLVYFWKVWGGMVRALIAPPAGGGEGQDKRELAAKLALATVPGAIAGYAFQRWFESLSSALWLAFGFLVSAAALLASDVWAQRHPRKHRATFQDAFMVGLAQVVALLPSVSRSGVTIAAGQARGLSRVQAVRFSFLMSAPIIAGAGLASLSSLVANHAFSPAEFVVGFAASFAAGLAGIYLLLKMVEKISFWPFAVYLVILSVILLYVG